MRAIEIEFLEEYKKLDSLCRTVFSSENGVSEYLDRMAANNPEGQKKVASWNRDYKSLKRLRWLRNTIVHEDKRSECDKADLNELKDFRRKMEKGNDPINQLRAIKGQKKLNFKENVSFSARILNFLVTLFVLLIMAIACGQILKGTFETGIMAEQPELVIFGVLVCCYMAWIIYKKIRERQN